MSELNPYAKFLDGRPLEVILASTPSTLSGLIKTIGPEKVTTPPAPGKWSPAEIACHLADCELAFGFRLRQTLAEDNHVIQPFDQENGPPPIRESQQRRLSPPSPPCATGICSSSRALCLPPPTKPLRIPSAAP